MGRKKGKYAGKRKIDSSWLWWLLAIPAYVVLLLLVEFPAVQFIWKILLSGAALYFSYFWKKDNPLIAKVILTVAACTLWLTTLGLSPRHLLLIETLLLFVSMATLLYWNIKLYCSHEPVLVVVLYLLISVLQVFRQFTYADPAAEMLYWPVYLVCGIATAAGIVFLISKGYYHLKDNRTSEIIATCVIAGFLGFLLPWVTVNNANYMLDTSDPTVYELTIGEKKVNNSSKGPSDYYLIVGRNGQILEFEVAPSKYHQYEVGDKLPVSLYEGALGNAYYVIE